MGLYSDNFYSWLNRHNAKPIYDDETMAEHDRHYHPNGYNPETDRCGRRKTERHMDSVERDNPPFTAEMIETRFGTKVRQFSKEFSEEEKSRFAPNPLIDAWKSFAEEPTKEERRKTISMVGRVLSDLEKRFNCKIKVDNLLVARLKDKEYGVSIGGFSLADRIATKESVIVIPTNPPKWGGQTYGHNDERNIYDMIRHEIGHALTTEVVVEYFLRIVDNLRKEVLASIVVSLLRMRGSNYGISAPDCKEEIAEMFSRLTDSEYKRGTFASSVENLVFRAMINEGI